MILLGKDHNNTPLLYLTVFCLWLLSYNDDMLKEFEDHQVVHALVQVVRVVMTEKVVRVIFAILSNLLNKENFNEELVSFGVVKVLETLRARKWKDSDIIEDMDKVATRLDEVVRALSSFEMYEVEVNSGKLSKGPVHTALFWRENIHKFENNNFRIIRKLVALLDSSDDKVLEVACYDVGEFARFHPDGRIIIQKLEGKRKLMNLLAASKEHSDAMNKEALLSVQKLMVQNWESLQSAAGVAGLVNKK